MLLIESLSYILYVCNLKMFQVVSWIGSCSDIERGDYDKYYGLYCTFIIPKMLLIFLAPYHDSGDLPQKQLRNYKTKRLLKLQCISISYDKAPHAKVKYCPGDIDCVVVHCVFSSGTTFLSNANDAVDLGLISWHLNNYVICVDNITRRSWPFW